MRRKLLGLAIPVLFVIGCLVSSAAHAQEIFGPHFNFISARGGGAACLTVKNGELLMVFPCNTSRESSVEVMNGFITGDQAQSVLRIKTVLDVPQVFCP